jgi:hypothetical protein
MTPGGVGMPLISRILRILYTLGAIFIIAGAAFIPLPGPGFILLACGLLLLAAAVTLHLSSRHL